MHMVNGQHVRLLRGVLKISQTKLADFVGVKQNTVARWEMGDRFPSRKHVERLYDLANSKGVNLDKIVVKSVAKAS